MYIEEIKRVLKPGGTITFGCKFALLPQGTDEFVNVDQDKIVEQMRSAGFSSVLCSSIDGSPDDASSRYIEIVGTK